MQNAIVFNKVGYDRFIDFLKGLCIVSVVLTHSIPYEWQQIIGFPFWGVQAVPVFLLIQSFHYLKHEDVLRVNWQKLWKRIILPFVVVQSIMVGVIVGQYLGGSGVLSTPLRELLYSGGNGPGSYYFWIYLQFALIVLPLFAWVQKRLQLKAWMWLIVFALVSEGLEILCSIIHISPEWYRLLAFRYVFLAYGGYVWVKEGIRINWKTSGLGLLSILAIVLFQYQHVRFEPWVFDTAWRYFHWFCYFWAMYGLVYVANLAFKYTGGGIRSTMEFVGRYSYEVFLIQMLVFAYYPYDGNKWVYLVETTMLSIVPVVLYFRTKKKLEISGNFGNSEGGGEEN